MLTMEGEGKRYSIGKSPLKADLYPFCFGTAKSSPLKPRTIAQKNRLLAHQ